MHIRLKDYGRNKKKRKEDIHESGFLLAGVNVGKTKHDDCIGTWRVPGVGECVTKII